MMEQPPFEKTPIAEGVQQNAGLALNEQPATPEQQKDYESYVIGGMNLIHSEKTRDQILEQMNAEPGADGIARTLVMVMKQLDNQGQRVGLVLPEELKWQAGQELLTQLLEVAHASGAVEDLSPEFAEEVVVKAIDLYMGEERKTGELDLGWMNDVDPEAADVARQIGLPVDTPDDEEMLDEEMPPEQMMGGEQGLLNGAM